MENNRTTKKWLRIARTINEKDHAYEFMYLLCADYFMGENHSIEDIIRLANIIKYVFENVEGYTPIMKLTANAVDRMRYDEMTFEDFESMSDDDLYYYVGNGS